MIARKVLSLTTSKKSWLHGQFIHWPNKKNRDCKNRFLFVLVCCVVVILLLLLLFCMLLIFVPKTKTLIKQIKTKNKYNVVHYLFCLIYTYIYIYHCCSCCCFFCLVLLLFVFVWFYLLFVFRNSKARKQNTKSWFICLFGVVYCFR